MNASINHTAIDFILFHPLLCTQVVRLRECSQIGENHSHPPPKFVRVPQRGLVDPNVLHQSVTVQMRHVASPVVMLQNVPGIEMVRPSRGRVQRGQRVMIVHR